MMNQTKNPNFEYFADGQLKEGFDYDLQVWVKGGVICDCGHPLAMKVKGCCNAALFYGATPKEAKELQGLTPYKR